MRLTSEVHYFLSFPQSLVAAKKSKSRQICEKVTLQCNDSFGNIGTFQNSFLEADDQWPPRQDRSIYMLSAVASYHTIYLILSFVSILKSECRQEATRDITFQWPCRYRQMMEMCLQWIREHYPANTRENIYERNLLK